MTVAADRAGGMGKRLFYGALVVALAALGIATWHSSRDLRLLGVEATRHETAAGWSLVHARLDLDRFRAELFRHARAPGEIPRAELLEHFERLAGRLTHLAASSMPTITTGAGASPRVVALPLDSLREARALLRQSRLDATTIDRIAALLEPVARDLQGLLLDFERARREAIVQIRSRIAIASRRYQWTIGGFAILLATLILGLSRETLIARRAETRFRDFADSASDWLWETDATGRLSFVSGAPHSTGRVLEPGRPLVELLAAEGAQAEGGGLTAALAARRPFRDLHGSVSTPDGMRRHLRLSGTPVVDRSGRFSGYRGVATDITELRAREERIRYLARHDSLTGLLNRSALQETAPGMFELCRRGGHRLALLLLDLDGFKAVNDQYGHDTGDRLLIEVARRLRSVTRDGDPIVRLGGDEFAILLAPRPDLGDLPERLSDRILELFENGIHVDGNPLRVGVSIGIALAPDHADDIERLLKAADLALYRAKQAGRHCHRLFTPELGAELDRRRRLEHDLAQAVTAGEIEVHYQPLVRLPDGRPFAVEALARWHHPELGPIPPSTFVPIAEEIGLAPELGRLVLREACRTACSWNDWRAGLMVSVNISPLQFVHDDVVAVVTAVLEETGLAPHRLVLEITENVLMSDRREVIEAIEALRRLGVQFAVDDFGTGYSSLSYLRRFPVQKLKIDRSFIRGIEHSVKDGAIVRSLVDLCRSLDIEVVAEGVESEAQAVALEQLGCRAVQGYLFGQPGPSGELVEDGRIFGALAALPPLEPVAGHPADDETASSDAPPSPETGPRPLCTAQKS